MSKFGQWDEAQVKAEAAKIENAARHGDSSQAFREEDDRITRSSTDPEVRRANAAAVTAQLERDGYLPVCGFDLAAAAKASYRQPQCGDSMGRTSNILTNSPSESIERAIYNRESYAPNLQFGDTRPAVPKAELSMAKDASDIKHNGSGEKRASSKSHEESMNELAAKLKEMEEKKNSLQKEFEQLKNKGKESDTTYDGTRHDRKHDRSHDRRHDNRNHPRDRMPAHEDEHVKELPKVKREDSKLPEYPKRKSDGADAHTELPKIKIVEKDKSEESKVSEQQAIARVALKGMVATLDREVAAQRMKPTIGYGQQEVHANVGVTSYKDGSMHIAGEPYGTIDIGPKTKLTVEQDGSILATDTNGTKYHFLSKPDATGLLFERTDKENNILRKYAPNADKLISEVITQNSDGGTTSVKQFNKEEASVFNNPVNTNRADWITSTSATWNKKGVLQSETVEYGRDSIYDLGEIRKTKEIFHYDEHGRRPKSGVSAEHFYDNGFKFTELGTGQTYIQRRAVSFADDPVKAEHQAAKNHNGTETFEGVEWALSNKQLRKGVHIDRNDRKLPEDYSLWFNVGDLKQ